MDYTSPIPPPPISQRGISVYLHSFAYREERRLHSVEGAHRNRHWHLKGTLFGVSGR